MPDRTKEITITAFKSMPFLVAAYQNGRASDYLNILKSYYPTIKYSSVHQYLVYWSARGQIEQTAMQSRKYWHTTPFAVRQMLTRIVKEGWPSWMHSADLARWDPEVLPHQIDTISFNPDGTDKEEVI